MVVFTPSASFTFGSKPSSLRAGSMSHRQLRCFRILNLSLFKAVTLPVILPTYSPKKVMMRSTQTGAVIRNHQGRPNASWMRSLNVVL